MGVFLSIISAVVWFGIIIAVSAVINARVKPLNMRRQMVIAAVIAAVVFLINFLFIFD